MIEAVSVPRSWLVAIAVVWAALFGGGYALGTGSSATTTTTTVTRTAAPSLTIAPSTGQTAPLPTATAPVVRVQPIVAMPAVPALRPYRLTP